MSELSTGQFIGHGLAITVLGVSGILGIKTVLEEVQVVSNTRAAGVYADLAESREAHGTDLPLSIRQAENHPKLLSEKHQNLANISQERSDATEPWVYSGVAASAAIAGITGVVAGGRRRAADRS